ncbi:hypothetical protein [Ruania halotolerans]|uniref:hypothetical protein n=1 Tax=Ruania halotolerans TaxID=2897773 RepID=UPI001E47362F|nr:hypothetical protein [Ruania halotolerans]UFU07730.1 hypothetical protein LQF10_06425 [Ruania halotolerans]
MFDHVDNVFDAIAARRMGGPLERPHRHIARRGGDVTDGDFTSYDPQRRSRRPEGI